MPNDKDELDTCISKLAKLERPRVYSLCSYSKFRPPQELGLFSSYEDAQEAADFLFINHGIANLYIRPVRLHLEIAEWYRHNQKKIAKWRRLCPRRQA